MENLLTRYRTPIVAFCIGVLFTLSVVWFYLEKNSIKSTNDMKIVSSEESDSSIKSIYIAGAVEEEKVCEIKSWADTFESVNSCITFTEDADLEKFETQLADLDLTYVDGLIVVSTNSSCDEVQVQGVQEDSSSSCVNINTATLAELNSLPGIGEVYAQRIINTRPYSVKDEIKKVKGIGDKTFAKLESLICL